jgi:hypothetical protein
MYSPSVFDVARSLAQVEQPREGESEYFARAAREAARVRRARRRRPVPARSRARGMVRPALISALIAGAYGAGHAL